MITIDQQPHLVTITVLGEFHIADFKEFEDLVHHKVEFEGPVDLLFDLRQMADFSIDVAWEEIKFSPSDFRRIVVLTDSQFVAWSAWLSQIFTRADLRVFADEDEARTWLSEGDGE
jgi:hypothetical protein